MKFCCFCRFLLKHFKCRMKKVSRTNKDAVQFRPKVRSLLLCRACWSAAWVSFLSSFANPELLWTKTFSLVLIMLFFAFALKPDFACWQRKQKTYFIKVAKKSISIWESIMATDDIRREERIKIRNKKLLENISETIRGIERFC